MSFIFPLTKNELPELVNVARQSFIESHGHSASEKDIEQYCSQKFTLEQFQKEFSEENNVFNVWKEGEKICGYSKIVINSSCEGLEGKGAKLERLYFLKSHLANGRGKALYEFIENLAKTNSCNYIWLNVWTENKAAVAFYLKNGYANIRDTFFKISETHSNPNYCMVKTLH